MEGGVSLAGLQETEVINAVPLAFPLAASIVVIVSLKGGTGTDQKHLSLYLRRLRPKVFCIAAVAAVSDKEIT